MSNVSDIVQAIREAPTPGVAQELLTAHIQKEHERSAETCENLRARIQQFQRAINRIAGHVSACCAGVDVEDSNGLGSHTSEEIIRRIDALIVPHASLKEQVRRADSILHSRYSRDSLASLYEMCNKLPACNMFAALSGVIQDMQFYQQEQTSVVPLVPIAFVSADDLDCLKDSEWQEQREDGYVKAWTKNNPPSRAIIPLYAADAGQAKKVIALEQRIDNLKDACKRVETIASDTLVSEHELRKVLTQVRELCIYVDDDGNLAVTSEPTIDSVMFDDISRAIRESKNNQSLLRDCMRRVADEVFQMARRSFLDKRVALKPDVEDIIDRALGG